MSGVRIEFNSTGENGQPLWAEWTVPNPTERMSRASRHDSTGKLASQSHLDNRFIHPIKEDGETASHYIQVADDGSSAVIYRSDLPKHEGEVVVKEDMKEEITFVQSTILNVENPVYTFKARSGTIHISLESNPPVRPEIPQ